MSDADPSEQIELLSAPDAGARARARAELVALGERAVAALLQVLSDEAEPGLRIAAARCLSEIAAPASADPLAALLADREREVRAYAANGLARIGDARALAALAQTIDDLEDALHHPYTLSLYALIDLGWPALPALAPLLRAPEATTRRRAFLAIQSVVAPRVEWEALSRSLGSYDPNSASRGREAATQRWIDWIAGHGSAPGTGPLRGAG